MIIIKKIKDKSLVSLLSDIPMLETLLVSDKNKFVKLLSKFKKTKKIDSKNKK